MRNSQEYKLKSLLITCLLVIVLGASARSADQFRVGYFEGGKYPVHDRLRDELNRQLEIVIPAEYNITFVPFGFRSANWDRDTCRMYASELVVNDEIDMVLTMGPWVVEDLLAAGFTKPIVAMYRAHPGLEGIVDAKGRPIADNLTVRFDPNHLKSDLTIMAKLFNPLKVGVLHFPSGTEEDQFMNLASGIGQRLGFEVFTATGRDRAGTYAYFKAYRDLEKKIDVLYLTSLWGMDIQMLKEFLKQVAASHIPTFVSDTRYLAEKGAAAVNGGYTYFPEARYTALKILKIIRGETPADLKTMFPDVAGLTLNAKVAARSGVSFSHQARSQAPVIPAPLSDEAPIYSLSSVLSRAQERNPGYLAKYDALEAASQAAGQVYSEYLPQLEASATVTHFDDNSVTNTGGLIKQDRTEASLTLRQHILSFTTMRDIGIASRKTDLSKIDLNQAAIDLELAVSLAYLDYLQAGEILKIRNQHRDLIDRNFEIAYTRFLLDENERGGFLRWEHERTRATTALLSAGANQSAAGVVLNVLINLPGNTPFGLDEGSFSEDKFFNQFRSLRDLLSTDRGRSRFSDGLTRSAQQQNPEIKKTRVRLDLGNELLARNKARFAPQIGLKASLNYRNLLSDEVPFAEKHSTWSIGGSLTLPIFEGASRFRERRKLWADFSRREYDRDAASLKVMGKVQAAAHQLTALAGSIPYTISSQELARQYFEIVSRNYEESPDHIVELLDAQTSLLRAEIDYTVTRYSFYRRMAHLIHDLGLAVTPISSTFESEFYKLLVEMDGR